TPSCRACARRRAGRPDGRPARTLPPGSPAARRPRIRPARPPWTNRPRTGRRTARYHAAAAPRASRSACGSPGSAARGHPPPLHSPYPAPPPSLSSSRPGPELLQVCLDERVQIPFHHTLYIRDLQLCPMVGHHRVRLEHVGPDLVAPGDVGLLVLELLALRLAQLQLPLVQRRAQHLHRRRPILVLAALVLARHHDPRRV